MTCYRFTRPQTVTHPSANRAQCRLSTLIKTNALTSTLRCHHSPNATAQQSTTSGNPQYVLRKLWHCAHDRTTSVKHIVGFTEVVMLWRSGKWWQVALTGHRTSDSSPTIFLYDKIDKWFISHNSQWLDWNNPPYNIINTIPCLG